MSDVNTTKSPSVMIGDLTKIISDAEEKLKSVLESAFKAFLEIYPEVYGVTWTQYTPYFNDGDACEFSVHDMYVVSKDWETSEDFDPNLAGHDFEEVGHTISDLTYYVKYLNVPKTQVPSYAMGSVQRLESMSRDEIARHVEMFKDLKALQSIPDRIFLAAFGDHVTVMATRDSFEIEAYDHD